MGATNNCGSKQFWPELKGTCKPDPIKPSRCYTHSGNFKPELDLSFLDSSLAGMDRDRMRENLNRIQRELRIAMAAVQSPENFVIFWQSREVPWEDARVGISKLGSMLQMWLAKEGVIEEWKAEEHLFEDPPPKTKEFITATRMILEMGLALGAALATRSQDD